MNRLIHFQKLVEMHQDKANQDTRVLASDLMVCIAWKAFLYSCFILHYMADI